MREARGFLALLLTCAILLGLSTCQRQGVPSNQVYQARSDEDQSHEPARSAEYYEVDEYYDDEETATATATATAPSSSVSSESPRQAKAEGPPTNGTLYEDSSYYYDDDYEDAELAPAKASQPQDEQRQLSSEEIPESSDSQPEAPINQTTSAGRDEEPEEEPAISPESPASTTSTEKVEASSSIAGEGSILIGEAIVSVVTTKSVVNGTFSVPDTTTNPPPTSTMTEESVEATISSSTENTTSTSSTTTTSTTLTTTITTEASSTTSSTTTTEPTTSSMTIQAAAPTGRSVSGARFLPFPSADKVEQVESTESIIDKLDRVQSELSSGFLANGRFVPRRYNKKPFSVTSLTLPTTSTTIAPTSSPIAPVSITSITKRPKVQTTLDDIAAFLPKDFPKSSLYRTTSTTTKRPKVQTTLDDIAAFLPKDFPKSSYRSPFKRPPFKTSTTVSSSNTTSTTTTMTTKVASTTEKSTASTSRKVLTTIEDISAFLPPGYKLKKEESTTEKSLLLSEILAKNKIAEPKEGTSISTSMTERAKSIQDLFAKSAVDISALLPPGYKPDTANSSETPVEDLLAKSKVDLSALLPVGFDAVATQQPTTSTTSSGSFKIVFPSRPGGRKPIHKITTPATNRAGGGSVEAATLRIQKGWPTRATTEFTGWPTSSTTPISIEKLLEAARTATVSSANVSVVPTMSEISSTSSTTTTTTTTVRPTTPGICDEDCEVAGTIKIVENAVWAPELLDSNTREWQDLADEIEREMNLVFAKSPVLRKWFRNIRIDSFSQGSVLVDYFVELADLKEKINTQQLKVIFHDSLRTFNFDNPMEARPKGPMKLGKFTIDPKSTDFVVIPRIAAPKMLEDENRLIPQWAIAVIVIGVGGLLFIIVFGVSVLVNRQQVSKLKPSITAMYGEEVPKNVMSHAAPPSRPASDYQKNESQAMWNDSGWHDKPFESTSHKILVDGLPNERKYNMYDSWKSEWNGYYYPPTHASGSNFSRHHPDYDINF